VPVDDQNKTGAPRGTAERLRLVAACPDLSPPQKAVLSLVALQHNEKTGYAWVSIERLAWQTSWVVRTVSRAFVELEAKGLITRSYRDANPAQSMKTVICWDQLHARKTKFEPKGKDKPGRVKKYTATREEDQLVADTLDVPEETTLSMAGRSRGVIADEIFTLLEKHFSGHSTYLDPKARTIMYECIWTCLRTVGSAERCLAIFEWVCNDPTNENLRNKINESNKLGGYIKSCFNGRSREFIEADKVNIPDYEKSLTALCNGSDNLFFPEQHLAVIQPFRAWLEAELGDSLLDIELIAEDEGTYLRVEIAEEFKKDRVVSEFEDSDNQIS
jgi:hypothetical protein